MKVLVWCLAVAIAVTLPAGATELGPEESCEGADEVPLSEVVDDDLESKWAQAGWGDLMSAASLYSGRGRRRQAERLYVMALKRSQDENATERYRESFAYEGMADMAERAGDFAEAEKQLKLAIACDPKGLRSALRKKMSAVCKELSKTPETEIQVAGEPEKALFYGSKEYAEYAKAVSESCSKSWRPPRVLDPLPVNVVFAIGKQGTAEDVFVQQSSGHWSTDRSLVDAIKKSRHFPPVPEGAPLPVYVHAGWAPQGMTEEQKAMRGLLWGF